MAKEKFNFIQPFKDLPNAIKGFPKNMIRAWKEPVTNSEEVKTRRKEIWPLLYLFVIVFLLMAILSAIFQKASDILMIVGMIPGLGAVACAFLLFVLKKAAQKFADIECSNCKTRIAYDENVVYKVIDKKFTVTKHEKKIEKNGVPTAATISAKGKEKITVEISCKCQACGAEKTFNHVFVDAECEKGQANVNYIASGAMLVQFEHDVNNECAEGFEGKETGTTARGVKITYLRTPEQLVKGYFGNEIQMR